MRLVAGPFRLTPFIGSRRPSPSRVVSRFNLLASERVTSQSPLKEKSAPFEHLTGACPIDAAAAAHSRAGLVTPRLTRHTYRQRPRTRLLCRIDGRARAKSPTAGPNWALSRPSDTCGRDGRRRARDLASAPHDGRAAAGGAARGQATARASVLVGATRRHVRTDLEEDGTHRGPTAGVQPRHQS